MSTPKAEGAAVWTIAEVAAFLGVSPRTVRRLVAARGLPRYAVGGLLRFSPEKVRAWLEAQERTTTPLPAAPRGPRKHRAPAGPGGVPGAGRVLRSGGKGRGAKG